MKRLLLFLLLLTCLASAHAQDVITTRSGDVLTGSIATETSAGVRFQTPDGMVRWIPTEAITKLQRATPDPEARDLFAARKAMTRKTAKAWFELGWWARQQKLNREATTCFERALALEPNHAAARLELGYHEVHGQWVRAQNPWVPKNWTPNKPGTPTPNAGNETRAQRLARLKTEGKWKVAHSSTHYDFFSNGSLKSVKKLGKDMDLMCTEFKRIFKVTAALAPFPIHLYKNQAQFMKAVGVGRSRGGFYDGTKIVAFHGTFGGQMTTRAVLFHEGTHQFQGLMGAGFARAKPWLIEGLAVYYESSRISSSKLVTGVIPRYRLAKVRQALTTNTATRLHDLIRIGSGRFSAQQYAESWSLIHFLLNAKGGKERFDRYWNDLKTGNHDPTRLFERVFDKPLPRIESAWRRYVMRLR